MAGGKGPPDKGTKSFLKCHGSIEATTVICVVCDSAFHQSCARQKNLVFLSELLVLCQDHPELTSKVDESVLSDSARSLIAIIKLKQTEEIKKDILAQLSNKSLEHNASISDFEGECEHLNKENELLRQLNSELVEKNSMLRDSLNQNLLKLTNKQTNFKTYAEITSSIKPQPKRIPKIIIKPINDCSKMEIKECITKCLIKEKEIQTNDVYCLKKRNEIMVKCVNAESVSKTEKLLKTKLVDVCEVKLEQLNNPKIKIVGIENCTNLDIKSIEEDINSRNFADFDSKVHVLHMYTNSKTNLTSVLAEVTSDMYKTIREKNYKIFVGWQCCRVYDLINIKPCLKCGRFGHSTVKCTNKLTCLRCSQTHKTTSCTSATLACLNCSFSNSKFDTNYNINHDAMDHNMCIILKNKIKKYIETTDYPVQPKLPTVKPIPISYQMEISNQLDNTSNAGDSLSDQDHYSEANLRIQPITDKQPPRNQHQHAEQNLQKTRNQQHTRNLQNSSKAKTTTKSVKTR